MIETNGVERDDLLSVQGFFDSWAAEELLDWAISPLRRPNCYWLSLRRGRYRIV
ncbi:MAG: hypothetical protein WBS24_05500 [Terriglobales bacterium]